jgi:CHAT domain-containing protein/tetratricopeptide (TPR) repeat protein
VICVIGVMPQPLHAQQKQQSALELLHHAIYLAELYNWAAAGPEFAQAEKMFMAAGDKRNALYAKLGRLRSTAEQGNVRALSAQLETELATNTLLVRDKQLRMFCLIVKGDVDDEVNSSAMGHDWEQVQTLAAELGDKKWQYRALGQLGLVAFYEGDLATARKNVGGALAAAAAAKDAGAQIRFLTVLGTGLVYTKLYEQALPYLDQALQIAKATPDAGYQFSTNEARLDAFIGLKQLDTAQALADDMLKHAREQHRMEHEALTLIESTPLTLARNDWKGAVSSLEQSLAISKEGGFLGQQERAESILADLYLEQGDLPHAKEYAARAAATTQANGDIWSVPDRLQALAEIETKQGEYSEADRTYDRAATFVDSTIGNLSAVLDKTALIKASSELYSQHFCLIAQHFNNPAKALSIIEQVRGRVTTDLLLAGSVTPQQARKQERAISQLQLKLTVARSPAEERTIRDQIFMAEQSRVVTPDVSILKARAHTLVGLDRVERSLNPSSLILEYVVAEPQSYCLVISPGSSHLVSLPGREHINALVGAYLKAVKAKHPAHEEGRQLYDLLLRPIIEAAHSETLVIVPDGPLHLIPFEGFVDESGRYLVETHTVIYEPSATSFYLLTQERSQPRTFAHTLLAVGGVPYDTNELKQASLTRGYDANELSNLPASKDEVLAAEKAIHDPTDTLLLGSKATESAFKHADLAQYRIIHLAVHGFASNVDPNRSALVLLSDPATGEDGFLQASEIVQLRLNADLVILSACDTGVGLIEGQEGIAALSRAFLLAGAKAVVSTLWSINDAYSLVVMTHFYDHLAAHEPAAEALTHAKRDTLREFGPTADPYYWAGFIFQGAVNRATAFHDDEQRHHHSTQSAGTRQNPSVR